MINRCKIERQIYVFIFQDIFLYVKLRIYKSFRPCYYDRYHYSDKPVCAQEAVVRYEVGLNAQAAVVCRVEAAPEAGLQFHWVFNTSTETIDIQQDQMRYIIKL